MTSTLRTIPLRKHWMQASLAARHDPMSSARTISRISLSWAAAVCPKATPDANPTSDTAIHLYSNQPPFVALCSGFLRTARSMVAPSETVSPACIDGLIGVRIERHTGLLPEKTCRDTGKDGQTLVAYRLAHTPAWQIQCHVA